MHKRGRNLIYIKRDIYTHICEVLDLLPYGKMKINNEKIKRKDKKERIEIEQEI